MTGIFEYAQEKLKKTSLEKMGVLELEDIVEYIFFLQENKFDSHVIVQGQNGVGKSFFMLAFMKELAKRKGIKDFQNVMRNNIFFSFHETKDVIKRIVEEENSVFGIDEAKRFLHYKLSMTFEQIQLINTFEYARSKRNCFIVCTNDVRRLNNNYRNSKAQLVIWFPDRLMKKEGRKIMNYAMVFYGLPSVEEEDKFLFEDLKGLYNSEGIRVACENKPTMVGYFLFNEIHQYLTDEEILLYDELKEKGIMESTENLLLKLNYRDKNFEEDVKKLVLLKKGGSYEHHGKGKQN